MGTKGVRVNENDVEWITAVGLMVGLSDEEQKLYDGVMMHPTVRGRRDRRIYQPGLDQGALYRTQAQTQPGPRDPCVERRDL